MARRLKIASTFSFVLLMFALVLSLLVGSNLREVSADTEHHHKHKPDIVPAEVKGQLRTDVDNGVGYAGKFESSGASVELRSQQEQFDEKVSPRTPELAF